jgi:hypothetical protein
MSAKLSLDAFEQALCTLGGSTYLRFESPILLK